jgi:hypothetical protein
MGIEAPNLFLDAMFIVAGLLGIAAIAFAVRAKRDLRGEPFSLVRRITLALMGVILVLMSLAIGSAASGRVEIGLTIWYILIFVTGVVLCLLLLMLLIESAR